MSDTTLLTEAQAASFVGIEPRTMRLWRKTRGVPHLKLTSKIVRFRSDDLNDWLNKFRIQMRTLPKAAKGGGGQ